MKSTVKFQLLLGVLAKFPGKEFAFGDDQLHWAVVDTNWILLTAFHRPGKLSGETRSAELHMTFVLDRLLTMSLWVYLYIIGASGMLGLFNFKPSWYNLNVQTWKRYWKLVINLLLAIWTILNPVWAVVLGVFNTVTPNMKPPQEEETLPVTARPPNKFKFNPRTERLAFSLLTEKA